MTYKKIISVFSAVLIMTFSLAVSVCAEQRPFFVSGETAEEMRTDMAQDDTGPYGFVFGSFDVTFDFDHAMRTYRLDYSKSVSAEKISDMIVPNKDYIVPQYNADGTFDTYALIDKDSGKWELCGACKASFNNDFLDFLVGDSDMMDTVLSYRDIYLIGDDDVEEMVLVSDEGEEVFFDLYKFLTGYDTVFDDDVERGFFVSSDEFIEFAKAKNDKYLNSPPDSAGAGGSADMPDPNLYPEAEIDTYPTEPYNEEDVIYNDLIDDPVETAQSADETAVPDSAYNDAENSDEAAGNGEDANAAENPQTGNFPLKAVAVSFALTAFAAFAVGKARH